MDSICNDSFLNRITELNNLPLLNINSPVSNIPHLTDLDADLHMPYEANFGYYTSGEFNNCTSIKERSTNRKAFGTLNCNIRSLAAN